MSKLSSHIKERLLELDSLEQEDIELLLRSVVLEVEKLEQMLENLTNQDT